MGLDMFLGVRQGTRVDEVAYWRKANAIHGWFVRNVQGGVDECQASPVTREQLSELRVCCQQVLDKQELATSLLPTMSGFFFGGTEYDEGYFDDLCDTVKQIDRVLSDESLQDAEFVYQSSW